MKLTKSFEQGVCIMAIMATQEEGVPVSSRTLQSRVGSSMTYMQKLLRKLVVAGMIKSAPGANGGFVLAKPISDISVLDVVTALEGDIDSYPSTGLFSQVFDRPVATKTAYAADRAMQRIFRAADNMWKQTLAEISLDDIVARVLTADMKTPKIDWNNETLVASNIAIGRKEFMHA